MRQVPPDPLLLTLWIPCKRIAYRKRLAQKVAVVGYRNSHSADPAPFSFEIDQYPLIDRCAPAADYEMSAIRRTLWQRPLNLLSVRQREIVAAAVAIALLGSRITERFDPHSRLPCQSANSIHILSHR